MEFLDRNANNEQRLRRNAQRMRKLFPLTPANFVFGEVPSGAIDGVNDTFTLASTPLANTVAVYVAGLLKAGGLGNDYVVSGDSIIFESGSEPQIGDSLLVNYLK